MEGSLKVEVTFLKLEVKQYNSSRILRLQYIGYETITPGNRILYFIFTQTQNAELAGHKLYGGKTVVCYLHTDNSKSDTKSYAKYL